MRATVAGLHPLKLVRFRHFDILLYDGGESDSFPCLSNTIQDANPEIVIQPKLSVIRFI